mgnify:CR=1 FL=1
MVLGLLICFISFLLQAVHGQTLLMAAALNGGDETVSMLLDLGVKTDSALKYAILSKSNSTIEVTADQPVCDLPGILHALAAEPTVQMTPAIRNLVEKAAENKETAR